MLYKNIKTVGHRRSGTHYITALLSINFLEDENYLKIYEKHKPFHRLNPSNNKDTAFFYIWRNFDDVSRSIYKMRDRFGLNAKSYDDFLLKKYSDMWKPKKSCKVRVDSLNGTKIVTKIGGGLKNINKTPYDFWYNEIETWSKNIILPNVYLISFDDVKNDFQKSMIDIAKFLGSDKTEFKTIDKKIGWTPIE